MGKDFLKFLDRVEQDINGFIENDEEEIIEESVEEPEEIIEEKIQHKPNVKLKLISELNRFGLNESAIQEIVKNVFSGNNESVYVQKKNVSSFKENVNKLNVKSKVVEKPTPMKHTDYASYILEGVEEMKVTNDFVNNVNYEPEKVNLKDLNMNNVTDHASALLS